MWTPMGRSGTRKRPKLSVPVVTAREKQRQDEGVADPAAERFAEMLFGVARADHSIVHTRNVAIDFSADIPTVSFMDESARAPGLERIMQKLCKMSSSRLELVQWIQDLLDAFQNRMQQVAECSQASNLNDMATIVGLESYGGRRIRLYYGVFDHRPRSFSARGCLALRDSTIARAVEMQSAKK